MKELSSKCSKSPNVHFLRGLEWRGIGTDCPDILPEGETVLLAVLAACTVPCRECRLVINVFIGNKNTNPNSPSRWQSGVHTPRGLYSFTGFIFNKPRIEGVRNPSPGLPLCYFVDRGLKNGKWSSSLGANVR